MQIYNKKNADKTGVLRVTKSVGQLLLSFDKPFLHLQNETINLVVERQNGDNEIIAPDVNLSALILTSVFGESKIIERKIGENTHTSVLIDLAEEGNIFLDENETLLISLSNLKSETTFKINVLELPMNTDTKIVYQEKVMLQGQKSRLFNVDSFDELAIIGEFDKIKLTYNMGDGNTTVEYTKDEIDAISQDFGDLLNTTSVDILTTLVSLVGVLKYEIFSNNALNMVLRDVKN